MNKLFILIACFTLMISSLWMVVNGQLISDECPDDEDYAPCKCVRHVGNIYDLNCIEMPLDEVAAVFRRTTAAQFDYFNLFISQKDANKMIPPNFLIDHVAFNIMVYCPTTIGHEQHLLTIDPKAFRSTSNVTNAIAFNGCDLGKMNFDFLAGFDHLNLIYVDAASNVGLASWTSMPLLPSLTELNIRNSVGLDLWKSFPRLERGLERLILESDQIQDGPMEVILNWALRYSSISLLSLRLDKNDLTRIPIQVSSFKNLQELFIYSQSSDITSILTGTFHFSAPIFSLDSEDNGITEIEAGAFQGDFSRTEISLDNNFLTRFEEEVFKGILQQNYNEPGILDVGRNPFDCTRDLCHLAWLIRDNRQLRAHLIATCSNGTSFHDLNPAGFIQCP